MFMRGMLHFIIFIQIVNNISRGRQHGKRVQANLGAKNHAVVMPDGETLNEEPMLCTDIALANKNQALNAIIGAAFGGMVPKLT